MKTYKGMAGKYVLRCKALQNFLYALFPTAKLLPKSSDCALSALCLTVFHRFSGLKGSSAALRLVETTFNC